MSITDPVAFLRRVGVAKYQDVADALSTAITQITTAYTAAIAAAIAALGFVARTTWSPTLAATGSMGYSGSASLAVYSRIGSLVWFSIQAGGTTSGTPSTGLTFTLPVTAAGGQTIWSATYNDGGGANITGHAFQNSATVGVVEHRDGDNWGIGASRNFGCTGFYWSA